MDNNTLGIIMVSEMIIGSGERLFNTKDIYYNKIIMIHRISHRLKPIWFYLLPDQHQIISGSYDD